MESIANLAKYKAQEIEDRKNTIILVGADPMSKRGFTQVPNFILENGNLTVGAKLTYGLMLRYAWEKNSCFPGQKTLAENAGIGERSISRYVSELQSKGFISIERRGLGRSNVYHLHQTVRKQK